jgi:glutaredoxin
MKIAHFACAAAALLAVTSTAAQSLFKIVGPDGRVTYTDRAPSASDGRAVPVNRETGSANDPALPFALRQVAARFPVTLFTSSDCGEGCSMARSLLARRGIPYRERTASSAEDRDAWVSIVGGTESPTLHVGAQALRGFTPSTWEETLDLAGYPKTSALPANYPPPAATPLIPPRVAASPPPAPRAAPAQDTSANPGGIRF